MHRIILRGCLVVCSVLVGGLTTAGSSLGLTTVPEGGPGMRVLQMNLCDSGLAGCYTGRSVAEAAAVIRDEAPDLVTLNEVCRVDVVVLERALAATGRGGATASAFQPARDRRTGDAVRCLDGSPYGIGMVARRSPSARGFTAGIYPVQDAADPEERAWLCWDAATFEACTTHLANSNPAVARAQCDYLLGTAIPAARARGGPAAVVLGGDLNLRAGGQPDVRSCMPAGYGRADDGGVQHVGVSDFAIASRETIDMRDTTDHPGLLVTITPADG